VASPFKNMMKRRNNPKPLNICWDIDDTIWVCRPEHCDQVPDYDLIQVLRWFYYNGDNVFIWSAGGTQYAEQISKKLGLDGMAKILSKPPLYGRDPKIDLTFDDSEIGLGTVSCLINRERNK